MLVVNRINITGTLIMCTASVILLYLITTGIIYPNFLPEMKIALAVESVCGLLIRLKYIAREEGRSVNKIGH